MLFAETISAMGRRRLLSLKKSVMENMVQVEAVESLNIVPGQIFHKNCRRTYCNKNVIACEARKKESTTNTISTPRSLRSYTEKFEFQEHCLFCGHSTKVYTMFDQ